MLRFPGDFRAFAPPHSSTERQCSDFWAGFGPFERICSVFQGPFQVILMTEWVDSDVLNWVGMLRFRQVSSAMNEQIAYHVPELLFMILIILGTSIPHSIIFNINIVPLKYICMVTLTH